MSFLLADALMRHSPDGVTDRPDGIIFDCDGVLVDVGDSYGATIIRVVDHTLDWLDVRGAQSADPHMIQTFKDTGAFNNEVDLAYAIILVLAASSRAGAPVPDAFPGCRDIRYVERLASGMYDMSDVIERLAYPGAASTVQKTFDQIFYGPTLYKKITGKDSQFSDPGLIENERVLLDDTTQEWLRMRFGYRIGMVTGRGYESALHTLGGTLKMFNMSCSAFLEDMPRSMAKPNPESLVTAIDSAHMRRCVYVGDSAEDIMMARAADRNVMFVGVWGTAADPERRRQMFVDMGADHTIRSITELRDLLE